MENSQICCKYIAKLFDPMDHLLTTYILIIITVLFSIKGFNDGAFTEKYLYVPYRVNHDKEWYRTLTHVMLHGDFGHLFFNMFSLFFFGSFVEERYINGGVEMVHGNMYLMQGYEHVEGYGKVLGTAYFVALYVLGGLFATLIPYFRHKDNPGYRSLGASGAVSAVIFAGILFAPQMEIYVYFIRLPAWVFAPLYLAFEFWSDRNSRTGIAHDAHIGGALFGILFALITNIEMVKAGLNTLF
jgi:membrane associated rhomboid family serine protease